MNKCLNKIETESWPQGCALTCEGKPIGPIDAVFFGGDLTQVGGDVNSADQAEHWPESYTGGWELQAHRTLFEYDFTGVDAFSPLPATDPKVPVTAIDARGKKSFDWVEQSFNYFQDLGQVIVFQMHVYGGDSENGRASAILTGHNHAALEHIPYVVKIPGTIKTFQEFRPGSSGESGNFALVRVTASTFDILQGTASDVSIVWNQGYGKALPAVQEKAHTETTSSSSDSEQ